MIANLLDAKYITFNNIVDGSMTLFDVFVWNGHLQRDYDINRAVRKYYDGKQ